MQGSRAWRKVYGYRAAWNYDLADKGAQPWR
jgi:hypothetical protein